MGVAAYYRGSRLIRRQFDEEEEARRRTEINPPRARKFWIHEYIDPRNGETVRIAYDEIGPLVNQHVALKAAP